MTPAAIWSWGIAAQHEKIEMREGSADQWPGGLCGQGVEDEGRKAKRIERHAAEQERGDQKGEIVHRDAFRYPFPTKLG
jgi:hypothetical protein